MVEPLNTKAVEIVEKLRSALVIDPTYGKCVNLVLEYDDIDRAASALSAAESRVLSLEEEVKRLREALKPFGEYLDEVKFDLDNQGRLLPDDTEPGWTYLTAGDFRRARNALKVNGNG